MKKILIISNPQNESCLPLAKEGAAFLAERGIECECILNGTLIHAAKDADMALVLGGDGTIINAAKMLLEWEIPVMGINMGRLGYLAAAEPKEMQNALASVLEGNYTLEKRITLSATVEGKEYLGANEVVLYRGGRAHLLDIRVDINGQEVDFIRADGIMAATPTGSTAYNLSAGGPVIVPTAENLVITPICAHSLSARPVVVGRSDVISFTAPEESDAPVLSVDGNTVNGSKIVKITVGSKKINLIRIGENGFYKTLRKKLSGQY